MPFERLIGGLAFLSLIPLIIFYLRRPKPTEQVIPSLMFFMHERGSTKFHSFFRQFIQNFLFLLQFLILSILALSIMGFFMELSAGNTGKTVIVLDVSASMQTNDRFTQAVEKAAEFTAGRISIVLAGNIPRVILDNGGSSSAKKLLNTIQPLDTSSNIGDAILVARDLLSGKGEIIVLSDFIATEGIDPLVAKRAVSQNAVVRFFNFAQPASNIGIIELAVRKSGTSVVVKNFNNNPEEVNIQISNNGQVTDQATLTLPPNSLEEFTFDTLQGSSEVKLLVDDDFAVDNTAYISVPKSVRAQVLLITNSESSNIKAALSASPGVNLDVAKPPVVNNFDYDIIVLHKFNPELMLPGYYKEIERKVKNGSSVIIASQENLPELDFLPVETLDIGSSSRNIINITNYFTDGIDFGVNERFVKTKIKDGATTIVSAANNPVLTLSPLGSGNVVYYGLLDEYSSFKSSTTYPQFWNRLVNFLTNTEDLNNFNIETGRIEVISSQSISTPSGKLKTDRILFDKAGFYVYNKQTTAANLLNVRESTVSSEASVFSEEENRLTSGPSDLTEKTSFETQFALLAAILIFLELLYIKFRGDL